MPSQVAATPMPAATAAARTGPLATRSAVAAGPVSSAVLSTAPMSTGDSATETASGSRKADAAARAGGQGAPELVDADQEGAGPSGGGDVRQRVAGERLAPGHREHPGHGRGDGDDGPDGQRDVHRSAAEEAGLDDVPEHVHRTT